MEISERQNKHFLLLRCLSPVFCYSDRSLTNKTTSYLKSDCRGYMYQHNKGLSSTFKSGILSLLYPAHFPFLSVHAVYRPSNARVLLLLLVFVLSLHLFVMLGVCVRVGKTEIKFLFFFISHISLVVSSSRQMKITIPHHESWTWEKIQPVLLHPSHIYLSSLEVLGGLLLFSDSGKAQDIISHGVVNRKKVKVSFGLSTIVHTGRKYLVRFPWNYWVNFSSFSSWCKSWNTSISQERDI